MSYIKHYFNSIGYKTVNDDHLVYIIKDFQRHTGITSDGIIGQITRGMIRKYNQNNFCPEVFEPIRPYIPYMDYEIESIMRGNLIGLGEVFNYYSMLYDFDVMHNINHAILESASGTSKIARDKNNLYGWACYDSSPYASAKKYRDFKDSIATWSKEYSKNYLTSGGSQYRGDNEYCVNIVYASSPIAGINKSFITRQLRNKLNDR
jgi:hypothetical protein